MIFVNRGKQPMETARKSRMVALSVCFLVSIVAVRSPAALGQTADGPGYERPDDVLWLDDTVEGRSPPMPGGNRDLHLTSLSGDGRWVAFTTDASLVTDDRNRLTDVYVRDMRSGDVELASRSSSGIPALGAETTLGNKLSWEPSISADGRYVAFSSFAINLVPGDTNAAADVFVYDRGNATVERVSVNSREQEARPSILFSERPQPSISASGRYVSFTMGARELVEDKTSEQADVFVRDRKRGETVRVSVSSDGTEADKASGRSSISGDGRFVAFDSGATNLVEGTTNFISDVYVRDLRKGTTERVSVASDGSEARLPAGMSWNAANAGDGSRLDSNSAISHDGRFITFVSLASNLVPNDTNFTGLIPRADDGQDAFLHDRRSGRTERISVEPDGRQIFKGIAQLWTASYNPSISPDGRYIAFSKGGSTPEEPSFYARSWPHAYVMDRRTGGLDAIGFGHLIPDVAPPEGFNWPVDASSLSRGGRFLSMTTLFGVPDPDPASAVCSAGYQICTAALFGDRGEALGVGELARSGRAARISMREAPAFSRIGVARLSDDRDDAAGSKIGTSGDLVGVQIVYRPDFDDMRIDLDLRSMPRHPLLAPATAGAVYGLSLSVDGRAYEVRAVSSAVGPGGELGPAFGLFSCGSGGPACTKVADLQGGFGTSGDLISFSVPLGSLQLGDGSEITDARAFAALGTYWGGPVSILDEAVI